MLAEDIAGDETTLLTNPRDARLRMDLGFCYLAAARPDDAIDQFERAIEISLARPPDTTSSGWFCCG